MNTIYLPTLKSIEINNYTLYPNGLNFKHNFVNGINLIMGGNGMGKTTFVNILKYGIIGHYKKEFSYSRTYLNKKIEKRISNPLDYFKKRMDKSLIDKESTVTIEFYINDALFSVKRSLYEVNLISVKVIVNNKLHELSGEVLSQFKYDLIKEETDKLNTLQYNYEKEIEKYSNSTYDDLIFFVNNVLYFGEDHRTVLWNQEEQNVQLELFNKYFNDPKLNLEREEAGRFKQYYNTQSRHRSEDIRVIKKTLDRVLEKNADNAGQEPIAETLLNLREEITHLNDQMTTIQIERDKNDNDLSIAVNSFNDLSKKIDDSETKQKEMEKRIFANRWVNKNEKYDLYIQNLQANETCPMCNQELEHLFVEEVTREPENCFLCKQTIVETKSSELQNELNLVIDIKNKFYSERAIVQSEIYEIENRQKAEDKEFNRILGIRRKKSSILRNLEFKANKDESENVENNPIQGFYDEINRLEEQKEQASIESNRYKEIENEISQKIEATITENVQQFSDHFAKFAESFLGVKCSLTYASFDNGPKRLFPVIGGQIRRDEEELSESQRFFIDHSFRMSILSFFYNKPSFYIVETPDSSLDISYEENAANIFLRFLEKPYALIITSNLNNSQFLKYLMESKVPLSIINLMELGKKSPIQGESSLLKEIYRTISQKILNR